MFQCEYFKQKDEDKLQKLPKNFSQIFFISLDIFLIRFNIFVKNSVKQAFELIKYFYPVSLGYNECARFAILPNNFN